MEAPIRSRLVPTGGSRTVMWLACLLVAWSSQQGATALSGPYVCTKIETYEVPVTKSVRRPYVVREMVWCLQVPPRCPRTRTEHRTEVVTENETKTRLVSECCSGYWPHHDRCLPHCGGQIEGCGPRGQCVAPDICKCDPGFHGALCNQGYELTTPLATLEPTKSADPPSTTEDRYHGYDNEIHPQLSEPTMATTKVSNNARKPTRTSSISNIVTSVPTTTIVKEITSTQETVTEATVVDTTLPVVNVTTPKYTAKNNSLIEDEITRKSKLLETSIEEFHTPVNNTLHFDNSTTILPTVAILKNDTVSIKDEIPIRNETVSITDEAIVKNETVSTKDEIVVKNETVSTKDEVLIKTSLVNSTKQSSSPSSNNILDVNKQQSNHPSLLMLNNGTSALQPFNYLMDKNLLSTITIILGVSMSVILASLLAVLLCQHRRNRAKNKPHPSPQQCSQRSPRVIHSQLPPTPREISAGSALFSPNNNVVILQHVTMATTNNTFKPAAQQPTISQELREALEATYDHPPSRLGTLRLSLDSGQRSTSLTELWDAVVTAAAAATEEEHLYDEIPCWNPRCELAGPSHQDSTC